MIDAPAGKTGEGVVYSVRVRPDRPSGGRDRLRGEHPLVDFGATSVPEAQADEHRQAGRPSTNGVAAGYWAGAAMMAVMAVIAFVFIRWRPAE